MEAWGSESAGTWNHHNPPRSGGAGATSSGGINISPAEVDIINPTQGGVTTSPTYLNTSPGAYHSAGVPDPATGDLADCGMRWGNQDGTLSFEGKSSGAWTPVMDISKTSVNLPQGLTLRDPTGDYWLVTVDASGALGTTNVGPTPP